MPNACICMCRLAGGDLAMSDLVRRTEKLALWLEQAENAVSSLPITATDKNFKELKVQQGLIWELKDICICSRAQ